ncbi:MAG: hypothetical protein ABIQ73_01670 [Acidimicrobiales bacterium]
MPRALSGRTLASSSFSVILDGRPVNTIATREVGGGFDVALVIETSTSGPEQLFLAAKAAAVEFILRQPAGTRVELLASDPPAVTLAFTADHAALVSAIKTLSRSPGDGLVNALVLAARPNDSSHSVTVVAVATAAESTVPAAALRDDRADSLRSGPSQLFAVGAVSEPLAQLAAESGGFARPADARQLVGAFDSVSSDLAGRYRLTFPVPANALRLEIRVTAPEGSSSALVALPSGAAKSAGTAGTAPAVDNGIAAARSAGDSNDSTARMILLAIVLVVALLVAGLVALFVVRRSRRRRQFSLSLVLAPYEATAPPSQPPSAPPPPPAPPIVDLRLAAVPAALAGYALTALCDDDEIAELRAAVEPCGIVVSQARSVDEALREVVTGRARALYVDGSLSQARELAAAVRQRNDAGWSSCPTLVHDSHDGPPDPALMAVADAFIAAPIDASRVVAALAARTPTTTEPAS